MTKEELEKEAEEYIEKNSKMWEEGELTVDEIVRLTYKDCAKENGIQWHVLEENPNDLPTDNRTVIDEDGNKVYYDYNIKCWRYDDADLNIRVPPIAWCEVPTFDKE